MIAPPPHPHTSLARCARAAPAFRPMRPARACERPTRAFGRCAQVLFSAVFMSTLRCKWVAYSQTDRTERPSILVACRILALVLAALLITYNVLEDVPMYHRLYAEKVRDGQADAASPHYGEYDLPLRGGLAHGLRCHRVMGVDDERWRPFMLWMSLNYLALPLWMCMICAITARHAVVGFNERAGAGLKC